MIELAGDGGYDTGIAFINLILSEQLVHVKFLACYSSNKKIAHSLNADLDKY